MLDSNFSTVAPYLIPQFRPVQAWMYFSVIGSTGGKGQLGGESDGGFHAGETDLILADDAEGGAVERDVVDAEHGCSQPRRDVLSRHGGTRQCGIRAQRQKLAGNASFERFLLYLQFDTFLGCHMNPS